MDMFNQDPNSQVFPSRQGSNSIVVRNPLEMYGIQNPLQTNQGQSWPRSWEDMGAIERVFSVLSVGNYAVANVAKAIIDGNPEDVAGAMWRGVTLQERTTFTDLLKEHNIPWAPLLGTALDIGLDPLTWLPGPITVFKLATKGTKMEQALQKAGKAFMEIEPVAKFNKLFNPKAGINEVVFDTMQLTKYGMEHEKVKILDEWNTLAKEVEPVRKDLLKWRAHPPSRPDDYEKYSNIWERFDNLTQRALSAHLITKEVVQDSIDKGGVYFPLLTRGWLKDGWTPGKSILGPTKKPGFANERTLKKYRTKPEEFVPDLRMISDTLEAVSKQDTLDGMRQVYGDMINTLDSTNPFKSTLAEHIEETIAGYEGNMVKLRRALHNESVYYTPIDDLVDLGKIYEVNLIQIEKQKQFKNFIYNSAESKANQWVKILNSGDIVGADKIFLSKNDAKVVMEQLRKSKITTPTAVDIAKIRVGDTLFDPEGASYKVSKKTQNGYRIKDANGVMSDLNPQEAQWFTAAREKQKTPSTTKGMATELEKWINNSNSLFMDIGELDKGFGKRIVDTMEKMGVENKYIHTVDPEVASVFNRAQKVFNPDNKEVNALLKFYDTTVAHWARWATIMRWPFHVRNFMSNTSLAFMSGVEAWEFPQYAALAADIQRGTDKAITLGGKTMSGKAWLDIMDSTGVRGWGWLRNIVPKEEVDQVLLMYSPQKAQGIAGQAMAKAYEVGERVGRTIEDHARIMVALNRLAKNGGNIEDAAKHTWKYMFQYDQLTDFERGVARRVIPFYTWMRKNIPLQVGELIKNPERYAQQGKMYNALRMQNPETEDEYKFKPDYMQDFSYFKIPDMAKQWMEKLSGKPFGGPVYVNIDLPWSAWSDIPGAGGLKEPVQRLLSGLNPAITLALGMGYNAKSFPTPGDQVTRFKGELKPAPWPFLMLPEGMWPALGIQPIRDRKTGRRIAGMPSDAVFNMMTVCPPLYELTKIFPNAKGYIEDDNTPWRRASFLTGISMKPLDTREERYWWAIDREKKLTNAVKVMVQRGKPMTREELEKYLE